MADPYKGITTFICDEIAAMQQELEKTTRHRDVLAEALAEIKAALDGSSEQPIADIVDGCIEEIKALSA
jgi:hypothetical protein